MKRKSLVIIAAILLIAFLCISILTGPNAISSAITGDYILKGYDGAALTSVSLSLDSFYKSHGFYPKSHGGLEALLCSHGHNVDCLPYLPQDHLGNPLNYQSPGLHHPNGFDVWVENKDDGVVGNW